MEAVEKAGEIVAAGVRGGVREKGDRDMVTETDLAVERMVRGFLAERTPGIAVLGEEEGVSGGVDAEYVWAVDPVDGTANFARGIPLCGVSVGLVHRGRPVLGVVDLPFLGARYHAVVGNGAFLGGRRLRVSGTGVLSEAVVALGDYAVGEGAEGKNRVRFALTEVLASRVQRIRMLGSAAVDLVWLAEGKVDASLTLSNKPWDTAAGVVIAREAGASVLDVDGTPHTARSSATIATAPGITAQIFALLDGVGRTP
ncbi:inositol monophosphatase family protein [Actinocorallia sp. A-T 12471]|uniref:inositol monophosphatase family protein n=1 Tax=Actinocorallia sp. A-T 12471 TaxID=3089813 RepID=UPI0029CD4A12|nr:inositol monophosphatase family protein [Actinocorallia sp. A-T 12471]MDX6738371.1 inositol monophosphatase family protein [Actinocorallia sp. A-T 12471]